MMGFTVVGFPVFGSGRDEYIKTVAADPTIISRDYIRNTSLLINLGKVKFINIKFSIKFSGYWKDCCFL